MNVRPVTKLCLVVLLASVISTLANAQTKADISLEGPWILYVDKSASSLPVLVVISPGGVSDDNDTTYFHTISIDNGDGYPALNPGVYCLAFDSSCTKPPCSLTQPPSCPTTFGPDHYPQTVTPLPVAVSSAWDWPHKYITPKYASAFVLPLPDYYSTDTGWYMRFNDHFDVTGKTYAVYNSEYATSLRLHYENGPQTFALQDCTPQIGMSLGLSACKPLANTDFANIGTLHIAMRSPENDNACDLHVRRAYPRAMGLLDGNNSKFAVVDLANGFDQTTKKPKFDDNLNNTGEVGTKGYRCLEHDAQANNQNSRPAALASMNNTMPLLTALNSFISQYEANKEKYPQLGDKDLLLAQIKDAYGRLDTAFPRFSQARLIRTLLELSRSRIQTLLLADGVMVNQTFHKHDDATISLPTLYGLEQQILVSDAPPTKSGNDCKAPMMLVQ